MNPLRVLSLFLAAAFTTAAHAAAPVEVNVVGPRVHLADVVPGATSDADLGPVPAASSSRLIPRAELLAAFHDAGATPPKRLPDAVRVVRKMTALTAGDVEHTFREALPAAKMPRGATLAAVRARAFNVPDGWTHATVDLAKPPRRTGPFSTSATLSFLRDDEILARTIVPIELTLSSEAATWDVARGAPVMLVIRRGLVEVTIGATAAADADVGGTLPLLLRPSGRVVSARLTDKDHAVSLEGS